MSVGAWNWRSPVLPVVLTLAALAIAAATHGAPAALATTCAPPRGPGDNMVHSHGLRAHNLSCHKARAVALACTRFTFGHSGECSAVDHHWDCTSHDEPPLGSAQRCVSGSRSMSIHWDD